jgi:hypothetical protein
VTEAEPPAEPIEVKPIDDTRETDVTIDGAMSVGRWLILVLARMTIRRRR